MKKERDKKQNILDSIFYILNSRRRGFTLIELLLSVALIALLSLLTLGSFSNARNSNDLTTTANQAVTLLRQAQSQSMAGYRNTVWGVRFGNAAGTPPATFYALFFGTYSTATAVNYYKLPVSVSFVTSTLAAGATADVIFAPVIGTATSTRIGFYVGGSSLSSTITIATSGQVSF